MSALGSILQPVGNTLLGTESAQRLRLSRSLLAASVYAVSLVILVVAAASGLADQRRAEVATLFVACGPLAFYAAIRSGWNKRFGDPALTLAQMAFAVLALILCYAICVPFRSALLLIVTQVMAFGMYSLVPRQGRLLTRFAIGGFGAAMAGLSWWRPQVYDPRLEMIHFMLLAAVLAVIGQLSSGFARLRLRLREQRAALREALLRFETLVRRDSLTGLVNRRCMGELLVAEVSRRLADPQPACLCVIDLDHFKRINDVHGHAAGDAVLCRFASVAQGCLRSIDVLARWGGEEFLLLLPGTNAAHGALLVERLRQALADPAAWQDEPAWRVTFSAGVTDWRQGEAPDPAIERADRAAYRAKAGGRDTLCFG